jgi:hypothetical protein
VRKTDCEKDRVKNAREIFSTDVNEFSSIVSIYATLWALQFPRFGEFHIDCEWVTVIAPGVPAHVGVEASDPYASFLPTLQN